MKSSAVISAIAAAALGFGSLSYAQGFDWDQRVGGTPGSAGSAVPTHEGRVQERMQQDQAKGQPRSREQVSRVAATSRASTATTATW